MADLTDEAKKLLEDSFRIVKEDKLYQRIRKATTPANTTPPATPPATPPGGPTPPPANPANPPNTPPARKSAYWGIEIESEETGNTGNP